MIYVVKDLSRSSGPTTLLSQGQVELSAQEHLEIDFEYIQRGRLHNLAETCFIAQSPP